MGQARTQHGDGIAIGGLGDALVVVWTKPATLERGRWLTAQLARRLQETEGSVVVVQLIRPSSKPPGAEARKEAAEMLALIRARTRRFINVPLGDDLWALLVRMVLRGIALGEPSTSCLVVAESAERAIDEVDRVRSAATPTRDQLRALMMQLLAAETAAAQPLVTTASWSSLAR